MGPRFATESSMRMRQRNDNISNNDGYRPNVGIVLLNRYNQVFWARRCGHDGWQFPQGGVRRHESLEEALYRELYEEVGLSEPQVRVLARTRDWIKYDLPEEYLRRVRRKGNRRFRGQKQIWYLLRLLADDSEVCLEVSDKPEFDQWVWIDWWTAIDQIVEFKRQVYEAALNELYGYLTVNPFFPRRLG